jgi:hypothetical protein
LHSDLDIAHHRRASSSSLSTGNALHLDRQTRALVGRRAIETSSAAHKRKGPANAGPCFLGEWKN